MRKKASEHNRTIPFHKGLFLTIGSLFVVFVAIILGAQYNMERSARQELLNDVLLDYNDLIYKQTIQRNGQNLSLDSIIASITQRPLRVTIVSATDGRILSESTPHSADKDSAYTSHLSRPEIKNAMHNGYGYALRYSETLNQYFFYSAKTYGDIVIRSSLPFTAPTRSFLLESNRFIYFVIAISVLVIIFLFYFCNRLGKSISTLNTFSKRAEQNLPLDTDIKTINNDIGHITQNLIHIYKSLQDTQKALSKEKEKLFQHLQFSKEGLAIFSQNKEVIIANNLFMQYLGIIADKPTATVDSCFEQKEFQKIHQFISERLYTRSHGNDAVSDSITVQKNGYSFSLKCIVFSDKTFEVSINDITQKEEEGRLKRQLTQNIAHELKTPVSSISGYLETILTNQNLNEERKAAFLDRCYAQTRRLSELLHDISVLNRLDEASDLFDQETIDLSVLVSEVITESMPALTEHKMTVSTQLHPQMTLSGNHALLYSIFRNLLDNAIAYAGIGTHVQIDCYSEDDTYYYFSFSDTGIGVSDEHLGRLFERFYRVDKGRSRKMGGTGLGLAIVKNAVLFHKGKIGAKNNPGGGLNFLFSLKKY